MQDNLFRKEEQSNVPPTNGPGDENALYSEVLIPHASAKVWLEMPFTIWCETCEPNGLVEKGFRFLAERQPLNEQDELISSYITGNAGVGLNFTSAHVLTALNWATRLSKVGVEHGHLAW